MLSYAMLCTITVLTTKLRCMKNGADLLYYTSTGSALFGTVLLACLSYLSLVIALKHSYSSLLVLTMCTVHCITRALSTSNTAIRSGLYECKVRHTAP
jgi:hypothetical protein